MSEDFKNVLKSNWDRLFKETTDQMRGFPSPPIEKPYDKGKELVLLPPIETLLERYGQKAFGEVLKNRRSRREYKNSPVDLEELAYLLWATQGVKKVIGSVSLRAVPSAGARHPFETYLFVFHVTGLRKGLYRYLPLENALLLKKEGDFRNLIVEACLGQHFVGEAAVVFVWTAVPYRTVWRYGSASYKLILLDAGHVCQNLYLACESIGCGTCAVAAYDQEKMDELVGVDGESELVVYLAPVGKV